MGGGGSESILSWVFKLINFGLLVAILVKFLRKPLKGHIANKHKSIKEKIEEAERKLREAETFKVEYENRLAKLDEDIAIFKKSLVESAEKEKKKIIDEATEFASRIKEQAKFTYEQEVREMRNRIKEDIAKLTIQRAEAIVRERFTKDDHTNMVEDFIEKLRSLN